MNSGDHRHGRANIRRANGQLCALYNHKFDPIQQKEYYQMTSAIAGVFHEERKVSDLSWPAA